MTPSKPQTENSQPTGGNVVPRRIRHIVAPTDFSDNAAAAVEFAARMAGRFESDLTLIKVRDLKSRSDVRANRIDEIMKADDEKLLDDLKSNALKHLAEGASLNTETERGQAHDFIPSLALRRGADLIVMGNKGSSALSRIFLGSTTSRVIRTSSVPVLTIPMGAKSFVRKIGIAVEGDEYLTHESLALLQDLSRGFDAEIVALHVGNALSAASCAAAVQQAERSIDRGQIQLLHSPMKESLHATLHQMADQAQVDLLCMVRGKHSVLDDLLGRSETLRESFDCPVPLLVLRG